MSQAVAIHHDELESILTSSSLVAIDCFATWCGPCQVISPLIDRLAQDYEDRARVVKLDLDRNKEFVKKFGVRSLPSVIIFKEGEPMETIVGVAPYEAFSQAIDRYL
jgi:thioredoxin 1